MKNASVFGTRVRTLLVLFATAAGALGAAPANSITITDLSGLPGTRQPFTISRLFAQGEIPDFAQAVVDGAPAATQCDVKTRWPDGSLQHAMLSFVAEIGARKTITVAFVNQPDGNNKPFLAKDDLLDPAAPWAANLGAVVTATQNSSHMADLRAMLANWDGREDDRGVRYWLKGPIVSQLIVEDKNPATVAYDFGWDCTSGDSPCSGGWSDSVDAGRKSLHPVFVVTVYRGFPSVRVEAIMENTWSTKLKDQTYSLEIRLGNPPAADAIYSSPLVNHIAKTRWRKVFWSGPRPYPVRIDYNLPYLIHSRAIPSYDLTKVLGPADVVSEVASFRSGDQGEIGGHGQWMQAFPTTGGRGDIGLFPRWYVRYLYTFDPDLFEVLLGDAAVSGYVPIHYRESDLGRRFLKSEPDDAVGRVLSIDARPTFRSTAQRQDTRAEDLVVPIGPTSNGNWIVDLAHQPSFAYIPYLITGDWYFLEELYFWASFDVAHGNPQVSLSYDRHADWGFINDSEEIRGVAWAMRNLAHAAFAAPDGTLEKAYFTEKLYNDIAIREGKYNITDGSFYEPCHTSPYNALQETSKWCWGRNTVAGNADNPLHFLEDGSSGLTTGLDTKQVYAGSSPWMLNYNHIVLGHLKELGFPIAKLQETVAKNLLNQILNPDYNPFLVASYRIPVLRQPDRRFLPDWESVKAGFLDPSPAAFSETDMADVEHGYTHIAQAAASFLPGIDDGPLRGQDAWDWMANHVGRQSLLNSNPKWALVPRISSAVACRPALPGRRNYALQPKLTVGPQPYRPVAAQSPASQACP